MISIKDSTGTEYKFEITKFPDGTSQCWKLNPEPGNFSNITVTWMFENEAELFHVCQLGMLFKKLTFHGADLVVPYLPFGRQDKEISNSTTFAKSTFVNMIYASKYNSIKTYDAHSKSNFITSVEPKVFLEKVAEDYDVICFPDAGALGRYSHLVPDYMKMITASKIRNQQTGVIEGLELNLNGEKIYSEKMLVFDDLCDRGGTFIAIANLLKDHNPLELGLAVSHGLFTHPDGPRVLFNAGYNQLFTTNSLLKNEAGYAWYDLPKNTLEVIDILGEL